MMFNILFAFLSVISYQIDIKLWDIGWRTTIFNPKKLVRVKSLAEYIQFKHYSDTIMQTKQTLVGLYKWIMIEQTYRELWRRTIRTGDPD